MQAVQEHLETQPALNEAVRFWWKLGWISFGGTAAHLSIMHEELVEKRGWIDSEHFFHALSCCMLLPGPEAQQLAIYIGWKLHGKLGGFLAGTLFVLPSVVILLALSILYGKYGTVSWMIWTFRLLKPIVVALVLRALIRIGSRALRAPRQWTVAAISFLSIFLLHLSIPLVMAAALLVGILLGLWDRAKSAKQIPATASMRSLGVQISDAKGAAKIILTCFLLSLLPLIALRTINREFWFWLQLSEFFTRTAFVTLGASYTVIPYVAHVAVKRFSWLSRSEMLDGFALAETTPGPLIIVVAFVGFMAGFHHFQGSIAMGIVALLLTTFYTFLPCFLFVFVGAPWVSRSKDNQLVKTVLQTITAVVVAAILHLTLFLLSGVVAPAGLRNWRNLNGWAILEITIAVILLQWRGTKAACQ